MSDIHPELYSILSLHQLQDERVTLQRIVEVLDIIVDLIGQGAPDPKKAAAALDLIRSKKQSVEDRINTLTIRIDALEHQREVNHE
jgi:hypothetical protein